jgi:symplekin
MPGNTQYVPQINEALAQQGTRMDKAAAEEKKRKAAAIENRKRPSSAPNEQPSDPKRAKLEPEPQPTTSFLATFDFTSLPAPLIADLIVANLEAFTEPALIALVQAYRQKNALGSSTPPIAPIPVAAKSAALATTPGHTPSPTIPTGPRRAAHNIVEKPATPVSQPVISTPFVKEEPVDPLQMDIDEEEMEYEPSKLNEEV